MQEMVQVLSDEPRQHIFKSIQKSRYFSLLIDETTDIAVAKQLIIFGRYLTETHEVSPVLLPVKPYVLITYV